MNPEISKIMSVVQKSVEQTKEGELSLTENLANFCKEAAFNLEEINRSVEWANTLTQLKLFKSGASKTEEFNIADPKKVKDLIFKEASTEVEKEASMFAKYPDLHQTLIKSASCRPAKTRITLSDYPKNSNDLVKKAYTIIGKLKSEHEEAQLEKQKAEDRFYSGMLKIASNLNKIYSEDFSVFEQCALDSIGTKCSKYIDNLEKMSGANNKRVLNYKSKKLITRSENVQLLKDAMANCELISVYSDVLKKTSSTIEECNERLANYARSRTA